MFIFSLEFRMAVEWGGKNEGWNGRGKHPMDASRTFPMKTSRSCLASGVDLYRTFLTTSSPEKVGSQELLQDMVTLE